MQEINLYLATTLKKLRQEKGWSLDKAASETGVSKAMLGQIERGESSPTIATMWKISTGFHQSLSSLLEPPAAESSNTRIRPPSAQPTSLASDGAPIVPIFPYEERFGFEMFELTLQPGYERLSEPHIQGVTEHVVVLSGELELLVDGEWIQLSKGASVRFSGDTPHGYRNCSQAPTIFHNILHYAQKGA
ncbi:helix-turn-helix transcriptional regulator [Amphritea atlantica]|uniref:Helix-turn-helix transcriptional regulator n=1 Tax=Amphritea atlantica TaxID=355243 RepID=A0ABY5GYF4_9GAMM|nr:helix-turn-helix transcriptional regulator [Amphritea atlantica]